MLSYSGSFTNIIEREDTDRTRHLEQTCKRSRGRCSFAPCTRGERYVEWNVIGVIALSSAQT
jgi:hypothetical protein